MDLLKYVPGPCSVYKRLNYNVAAYKCKQERQGAYDTESPCFLENQKAKAYCYPEASTLSQKCNCFHYRRKPIGIQRMLDADQ